MNTVPTEFLLPKELDPGLIAESLGPRFALAAEGRGDLQQAFFDTFDGRLHTRGQSLVHQGGRLTLVNGTGYSEIASAEWPRVKQRVLVGELPDGPLRTKLAAVVDVRALTMLARIRGRRQIYRVTDDEGKTVVRLLVEEPELADDGGSLQPRLRVVGVRGYDRERRRVCRLVENRLGLAAAEVTMQDEAVERAGGTPGGVSAGASIELRRDEPARQAGARLLRRQLTVIESSLPGAIADIDSEFLHDLRVGVRRTRSLLRELQEVFPADARTHFRAEFRWLQQVTGPCRDLDVYLLEFDGFRASLAEPRRHDLDPLRQLLKRRRSLERRRLVRALRSDRTTRLLAEWATCLDGLDGGGSAKIAELAAGRIRKVYRRMVKLGGEIGDGTPPEALHDLRKQGKELRYLLEFFACLFPAQVVTPAVRSLKALQGTLGQFQDRQVQALLINSLGDEVRALDDGAAALMAMGQLIERLEDQEAAARAEFAERFANFAAGRQRAMMEEAFR